MSKLYALAMTASYQDGERMFIDTLAAAVLAESHDEAVDVAYDYIVQGRPSCDGWKNHAAAASEIPEEIRYLS